MTLRRAAATLCLAAATTACAGVIYLDPTNYSGDPTAGANAAHARFRVDYGAWDLLLDRDRAPKNGNDLRSVNLGNTAKMNGVWWAFTLDYTPEDGLTYTVTGADEKKGHTLKWKKDEITSFDTITLESRAFASVTQSRSLDVRDLAFAIGGDHEVRGAFHDLDVASVAGSGLDHHASSFAWANMDLSLTPWTLSGRLRPTVEGSNAKENASENLRLYVDLRNNPGGGGTAPEPGTLVLLAAGLALTRGLWRRGCATRPQGTTSPR
jgi:hypothetical protein